jgi:hypothetical protein
MELDLRVPGKARNCLTTCAIVVSEEELCSVELVIERGDWILLAHYKVHLRVLDNTVMSIRFQRKWGIYCSSATISFSRKLPGLHDELVQLSGIALGYGLDDRGFQSRQGMGISLFTTASRPVLGPTQPPI